MASEVPRRLNPQEVAQNFLAQLPKGERFTLENQLKLTDDTLAHLTPPQGGLVDMMASEKNLLQEKIGGKIEPGVLEALALRQSLLRYLRLPLEERTNSPFNEIAGSLYVETGIVAEARLYQTIQLSSLGIVASYNERVEEEKAKRVAVFTDRDETRRQMTIGVALEAGRKRPLLEIDDHGEMVGRDNILDGREMTGHFLTRYQLAAAIKRQLATPAFLIIQKVLEKDGKEPVSFPKLGEVLGLTEAEICRLQNHPTSTELSHILDQKIARVIMAGEEDRLDHQTDRDLYGRLCGFFDSRGRFEPGLIQKIIDYPGVYDPKTGAIKLEFIADPDLMILNEGANSLKDIFDLLSVPQEERATLIESVREDDQRRINAFKRRLTRLKTAIPAGRLLEMILPVFADNMASRSKLTVRSEGPFWDEIGIFDPAITTNFVTLPEKEMAAITPIKQIVFDGRVLPSEILESGIDSYQEAAIDNIEEGVTFYVPSWASAWVETNNGQINATGINPFVFVDKNGEKGVVSFLGKSSGSINSNQGTLYVGEKASVFCREFNPAAPCTLIGSNALIFLTEEPPPDQFIFRNALPPQIKILPPLPEAEEVLSKLTITDCFKISAVGDIFLVVPAINKRSLAVFRIVEEIREGATKRHLVFVDGQQTDKAGLEILGERIKSKTGHKMDFIVVCHALEIPIDPSIVREATGPMADEPVNQEPPELYAIYQHSTGPLGSVNLVNFHIHKSQLIDRLHHDSEDEVKSALNELAANLAFNGKGDERMTLFKLKLIEESSQALIQAPTAQNQIVKDNHFLLEQMLIIITNETETPLGAARVLYRFSLLLLALTANPSYRQQVANLLENESFRASFAQLPLITNQLVYLADKRGQAVREDAAATERNIRNLYKLLYGARTDLFVTHNGLRTAFLRLIPPEELKQMETQGDNDYPLIFPIEGGKIVTEEADLLDDLEGE